MGRSVFAAALLAFFILQPGCGAPSEEARVMEVVRKAAVLAERGDLDAMMELLTPGYYDFRDRDKDATRALVEDYLTSFRGVVIHVLGAKAEITEPGARAAVTADLVLSSGAAEAFRKLVRFTGDYFRFDLELEKFPGAQWRIAYADWRSISLSDLFPESLEILKELFPGL
ncbi:MAG: hypothetical protein R6X21_09690 [Candidatus Aminicenantes bacterium]